MKKLSTTTWAILIGAAAFGLWFYNKDDEKKPSTFIAGAGGFSNESGVWG